MELLEPVSIVNAIVDELTIDDLPLMSETNMPRWNCFPYDFTTGSSCKIPFNKDTVKKYKLSNTRVHDDFEDIMHHKRLYVRENLYPDQRDVFDHVTANPNDIVLLQGGPGTGKTFTMLTVGNHFVEKMEPPPNAVIFKRDTDDTVHMTYRFSAHTFTVEQFMTRVFHLNSADYEMLERQLNEPMSVEHFLNAVVSLTRKLTLCPNGDDIDGDNFRHPLLILHLFTVTSKPFLLIIMMTLHRYRIGAVICGDKNLLQNVYNSTDAGECSAYDIVSTFSTKTFNLSHNRRRLRYESQCMEDIFSTSCYDSTYNDKVNFISTLNNDRELDDWGYALVSAMFYKNLVKNVEPADTILARSHKYLTKTVVEMVNKKKIPTSYWQIKTWALLCLPDLRIHSDKYLKFLPLIVGNPYFVNVFSERMLCTLESIDLNNQTEIQSLTVRMSKTNEKKIIEKGKCSSVMFEKHLAYLLSGDDDMLSSDYSCDDLYNFPLYPAFIKTIHMSMGRTICNRVSLILNKSTYQCLYVAMTRVPSPVIINSVVIPNQLQHLISVLLNFDVTDLKPLEIGQIKEKILKFDYVYYEVLSKISDPNVLGKLKMVAEDSLSLDNENQRVAARENLKKMVKVLDIPTKVLWRNINQAADDDKFATYKTTLPLWLKMKNTIASLATLTPLESRVWIHEFLFETKTLEYMRVCRNSLVSTAGDFLKKFKQLNDTCDFTESETYRQGETSMGFMKKTSTQKYKADLEADPDLLKEWVVMTAADDEESPIVAATILTPNDDTVQCVKVFIHNLVHRDHRDSNQLYELLKKRIKNNAKKRTIQ